MNDAAGNKPLPIVAAIVGAFLMCCGVAIWVGIYAGAQVTWLPALINGILIGVGIKIVANGDGRAAVLAIVFTALAGIIGYLITDMYVIQWVDAQGQPVQPTAGDALGRLVKDLVNIVFIALGSYIAYAIAATSKPRA